MDSLQIYVLYKLFWLFLYPLFYITSLKVKRAGWLYILVIATIYHTQLIYKISASRLDYKELVHFYLIEVFFSPENENISCWPLKYILISRYRWTPVENSFEIFLSRKKLRSCQRIYHVAVIISVDFWALLIRFHASAHFAFLCQIRVLPHFLSKSQLQP